MADQRRVEVKTDAGWVRVRSYSIKEDGSIFWSRADALSGIAAKGDWRYAN